MQGRDKGDRYSLFPVIEEDKLGCPGGRSRPQGRAGRPCSLSCPIRRTWVDMVKETNEGLGVPILEEDGSVARTSQVLT